MNKINFDKRMQEQMGELPKGTRLLLHSCCAPCSTACLERLHEKFSISVFYYNPNIDDREEYEKRKAEQIRLLERTGWADIVDCDHDAEAFQTIAQGLEGEPERGARCYRCYALRLEKTAEKAKELGVEYFATTLTLSPLKNVEWLNEIGEKVGGRYGINYLYSDFKKQGGYLRSIELSKEYGLYRQDFCGCKYSKRSREE
jgi:predicted adenine nucleotide alpha hydrolase (AANH) superfamily ATPase